MRIARTNTRAARRASIAALCGTTALVIVGGSALGAGAANAATGSTYSCLTTSGSTQLVDFSGSGTGLINTGSSSGLVGIATGANGLQIGLLNCALVVSHGTGTPATTTVLVGTPTTPTTTPTVPVTTPTTPAEPTTPVATAAPEPTATPTTPAAAPKLETVKVSSSSTTVYPSAKGYKNSKVTFSIKGLTSASGAVKITGKAVLKKGTKVVKTWTITSSTTKLSWNGKIGNKVKPGVYTLTVTAKSADGTKKVTTMKVRVSAKHLVTRSISVLSKDIAAASTAALPAKVAKAFALGAVTARVQYTAHVTGTARLVFAGGTAKRYVVLQDGTHTTKAMALPKGFEKVTIGHDWKPGQARLVSLRAIFTYKQLV